jgi:hypothetical protein
MGMFDKPKLVTPSAPKKAAKKGKPEIEIAGVEHLAMIDALQDTLETLRATIEGEIKAQAVEHFVDHIAETGQRPENFNAVEGGATASMQLRRKSSSHALSDEAVALLKEHGIEPEKQIVTPELFAINPAYAGDKALLTKVEKAIAKIVPGDFIMMQDEVAKFVVSEDTFNKAISKRAPAAVIQSISTVSCGPKLKNTNLSAILEFVGGLIDAPAFGTAADQAKDAKKLRVVK